MKKFNIFYLLLFVAATEAIGFLGALTAGNIPEVYATLNKPPLSPPDYLFGIVWPILYALIGVAAYLTWNSCPAHDKKKALFFYCLQLGLNFLWSTIFFRFGLFWLAAAEIIVLNILVVITLYLFAKINKLASYLVVPYLLWLLFATYLNIAFAILN